MDKRTAAPIASELVDKFREFFKNAKVVAATELNAKHYYQLHTSGIRVKFDRRWFPNENI